MQELTDTSVEQELTDTLQYHRSARPGSSRPWLPDAVQTLPHRRARCPSPPPPRRGPRTKHGADAGRRRDPAYHGRCRRRWRPLGAVAAAGGKGRAGCTEQMRQPVRLRLRQRPEGPRPAATAAGPDARVATGGCRRAVCSGRGAGACVCRGAEGDEVGQVYVREARLALARRLVAEDAQHAAARHAHVMACTQFLAPVCPPRASRTLLVVYVCPLHGLPACPLRVVYAPRRTHRCGRRPAKLAFGPGLCSSCASVARHVVYDTSDVTGRDRPWLMKRRRAAPNNRHPLRRPRFQLMTAYGRAVSGRRCTMAALPMGLWVGWCAPARVAGS
jgi:hypothetical protein